MEKNLSTQLQLSYFFFCYFVYIVCQQYELFPKGHLLFIFLCSQLRALMAQAVSNLLASLGHTGRRVVLGHTLNTQTLMKTDEKNKVVSKFTILCWAAFIAIRGCMRPTSFGLDTPVCFAVLAFSLALCVV